MVGAGRDAARGKWCRSSPGDGHGSREAVTNLGGRRRGAAFRRPRGGKRERAGLFVKSGVRSPPSQKSSAAEAPTSDTTGSSAIGPAGLVPLKGERGKLNAVNAGAKSFCWSWVRGKPIRFSPFAFYPAVNFCLLWLSTFNLQRSTEFFRLSWLCAGGRRHKIRRYCAGPEG